MRNIKLKLKAKLVMIFVILFVVMGVVTQLLVYSQATKLATNTKTAELNSILHMGLDIIDTKYPGDWRVEGISCTKVRSL